MAQNSRVEKLIVVKFDGKQAQISINNTEASLKQLNSAVKDMNTGMNDTSMATGAASATVLELGRTVSDSNYGIRGMANNLSQLASNFIYTTKSAGTLMGGLMDIKNAMMGPLGLILLFQGAIAMLERWSMTAEKATDVTKDLNDAFISSGTDLKVFLDQLNKSNFTQEELTETVEDLNLKYKDLNVSLDENGELTDESREAIDRKINSLERLARANALLNIIEEKNTEVLKEEIEINKEREELVEKYGETFVLGVERMIKADEEALKSHKGAIESFFGELDEFTEGSNEQLAATTLLRIKDRTDAVNEMKDAISDIMDTFGEEGLPVFGDPKSPTKKPTKEEVKDGFGALGFFTGIDARTLAEMYDELKQIDFDLRRRRIDSMSNLSDEMRVMASQANNDLLTDEIEHKERMLETLERGSVQRFEAENEISMMRMDLQDAELEHELLIIDEKMRAQMEYVGFVSGIGDVLAGLGKRSKELATLSLIVQKGAAIAEVVIAASQSIAARTAAHALIPPFITMPTGVSIPNPIKGIDAAAMAKDITMTKVGAGISIAAILATAIQGGKRSVSSAGGRAGGGAEGGGGRTFDFNLVGSTGTNQLAEAVGAQFQEPIQAFVVSSQITSQQELDLEISTGASLGD